MHALLTTALLRPLAVWSLALGLMTLGSLQAQGFPVTFESLAEADRGIYAIEQVRSVIEPGRRPGDEARRLSIRENLWTSRGASSEDRFRLEFAGLVNTQLDPAELQRRKSVYANDSAYLHQHAGFRIEDPATAAVNYALLPIDAGTRLGRDTWRVAIIPYVFGRTPWVLEVDQQTGYPLYRAEYNAAGLMISTLEVTKFETFQSEPSTFAQIDWWKPTRPVEDYPSIEAALSQLPNAAFVEPTAREIPLGYELSDVRVVRDLLNARPSLVLTYSDGVDEFFSTQTANASAMTVPPPSPSGGSVYAIAVYQDFNVAQFLSHWKGVHHQTVGRAGLAELGNVARGILELAVTD